MRPYRIIVLLAIIGIFAFRLTKPEMTEAQFFLRFWWIYGIAMAGGVLSEIMLMREKRRTGSDKEGRERR